MKLGVMTVLLSKKPVEEVFKYLHSLGVQTVEIGTGGAPGNAHMDPVEFLKDPSKVENFKALLKKYEFEISAFSCHDNPVHPDKAKSGQAHEDFVNTCKIAQKFGVDTVITFSGCPGDGPDSKYPNWVTCAWPTDYPEVLDYQWNDVLIPYWKGAVKTAAEYGVTKIALEMHPGFCCYNPRSLMRLREAVGPAIGANFDPSHLFWQGIRPTDALKYMGNAVHHFHAKDCKIDASNVNVNGVLDTGSYSDVLNRGWVFRTIGYGHDYAEWKDILSTLRVIGYNGAISIEHEDGLMSIEEGLERAISFLKDVILFEDPPEMWWA